MLSRAQKYQIKAQNALAARECGGQEAAVEASDRLTRHQSLFEYGNAKMLDKFICLDTAAELDRFSGNPRFAKLQRKDIATFAKKQARMDCQADLGAKRVAFAATTGNPCLV